MNSSSWLSLRFSLRARPAYPTRTSDEQITCCAFGIDTGTFKVELQTGARDVARPHGDGVRRAGITNTSIDREEAS